MGLIAFNTATLYKHLGLSSFSGGSYFTYCDEFMDMLNAHGIDRLIDLATIPLLHPPMGAPLFLHNITGLTLKDLNELDPNTLSRLETKLGEFAKDYNAARPKDMDI